MDNLPEFQWVVDRHIHRKTDNIISAVQQQYAFNDNARLATLLDHIYLATGLAYADFPKGKDRAILLAYIRTKA